MSTPTPEKGQLRPIVVGANHKSSTMMLRDRIFVEDANMAPMLAKVCDAGVAQALVISTCDRVDIVAMCDDVRAARHAMLKALAEEGEIDVAELEGQTYTLFDSDAALHVFRVTASLDSLMVGEPQIFGQVKAAHRQASEAGTVGTELESLMQAAYGSAKRVRNETQIGEGPVSMATSAVQVVRDLFGAPNRCRALLIGAGEMGELIAHDMQGAGLGHLTVLHPRLSRAEALARDLTAHVAPMEDLQNLLVDSDIVLTALGSRRFSLEREAVEVALRARRSKPIFIVDAAVPGDVAPAVEELADAFVYTLDDLERVALKGRAERNQEATGAELIIAEEVEAFLSQLAERTAVPALVRMRSTFVEARRRALADSAGDAEKATRLMASRLLHGPSEALRRCAAEGGDIKALSEALETLFAEDISDIDDGEGSGR